MFNRSLQKMAALFSIFAAQVFSNSPPIIGLIGGFEDTEVSELQYAATVSPSGIATRLNLGEGIIEAVALNESGLGLIAGSKFTNTNKLFAAFISSDKGLQEVPFGDINIFPSSFTIGINNAGLGLIGTRVNNIGYIAFVTPDSVTQISASALSPTGTIRASALNDNNMGIVGGQIQPFIGDAYAALVFPNIAEAQEITLNLPAGSIDTVAINNSGIALIGGFFRPGGINIPYAAYVVNGAALPITLPTFSTNNQIHGVALNASGVGLIGGTRLAGFVYPNQTLQQLSGLAQDASIFSTSINDAGYGLIGGRDNGTLAMYAALVNPNGTLQPIMGLESGAIVDTSINQFNQGLIGGETSAGSAYAAIISPSGLLTPLNLGSFTGLIQSVAINAFFLSQLPTSGLSGNNLLFAEYINSYAPQNVFYFVPSLLEGSFANALESAAPTRNAISFYSLLQNAFYFTTALSTHIRDQRYMYSRTPIQPSNRSTAQLETSEETEEDLLASRCFPDAKTGESRCWTKKAKQECPKLPPYTVWLEAIGALAYFDSQKQTPGFNPSTGGANLGFDARVGKEMTVGGGATYLYTRIHEKQDAGSSHINQEDLYVYASWEPKHFYLDLGLWGGLFQTHQDRHIHMPGFSFHALSKPKGWQLTPHLELGWIGNIVCSQKSEITWNLLGMLDWAHAWQRKYKETGNSPFNVQQGSHHGSLLRTEAGVRFSETLFYSNWNLIFQEKGSYVNVQSFNAGTVKGFIVASPGSFTLETLNKTQNLGVVQFLISAASYKKWHPTGTIFYQGEFGSSYQSHQLGLEFAMSF